MSKPQEESPMKVNISVVNESPLKKGQQLLNSSGISTGTSEVEGDIGIVEVYLIKFEILRAIVAIIIGFCFGLVPFLCAKWSVPFRRKMFFGLISEFDLTKTTHFLVKYSDQTWEILQAIVLKPTKDTFFEDSQTKGFRARKLMYAFNFSQQMFQPLEIQVFKRNNVEQILKQYGIPLQVQENQDNFQLEGLTAYDSYVGQFNYTIIQQNRLSSYGRCMIDIDIPNLAIYMFEEMTAPLYMVQYATVTIWFIENYLLFAIIMLVFTTCLTLLNYGFFRSSMKTLRKKAIQITKVNSQYTSNQTQPENNPLIRNQSVQINPVEVEMSNLNRTTLIEITSDLLIPGDLILLEDNMILPADCILFTGEVFVNEVNLTGESVPVPKFEIELGRDGELFYKEDQKFNTKSLLYEGTTLIKTRPTNKRLNNICVAMVHRTGFMTFKGQIFRSLVFVKNKTALFQITAGKFILILASMGAVAGVILLVQFLKTDISPTMIVIKILDLIIFVAPPAVPIMTTFCLTLSLARLRMNNIFGINPQALLQAGKVTTCCFDKTGTLTVLHLDFNSYITVEGDKFNSPIEIKQIKNPLISYNKINEIKQEMCFYLFATCHSIIYSTSGELLGDPLDIKMFEASAFQLIQNDGENAKVNLGKLNIEIERTFPFSSDDQCMSVLVTDKVSNTSFVFVKGSPEKLQKISFADSVPKDFENVLNAYTMQGLRVLGMGYKKFPQDKVAAAFRNEVESDLTFLGLIVFVNPLKNDTAEVLARLRTSGFKVKMISGDNSLTCAQTAKNAAIVSSDARFLILEQSKDNLNISEIQQQELKLLESINLKQLNMSIDEWVKQNSYLNQKDREIVMNGAVLETILNMSQEKNILQLILKTSLFGRCRPEHKAMVIRALRSLGVVCSMCGDGANDCPAIKAADLGISFAATDASISAPFSSMSPSINCVEKIMLEGKCTTQNSIEALRYYCTTGIYKYVINYCLLFDKSWMSQVQNIFSSYILGTLLFNLFFGLNQPVEQISSYMPNDDLTDLLYLATFFAHSFIGSIGVIIIYQILIQQDFYIYPDVKGTKLGEKSMANTALMNYFYVAGISTLIAMYFAKPFKKPLYKNILLSIVLLAKLIWCIVIIVKPMKSMKTLEPVAYDDWFCGVILGVWAGLFIIQYLVEIIFQKLYLKIMKEKLEKRGY